MRLTILMLFIAVESSPDLFTARYTKLCASRFMGTWRTDYGSLRNYPGLFTS